MITLHKTHIIFLKLIYAEILVVGERKDYSSFN